MVQAIAVADWCGQFIEAAKSAAPERFSGDPRELKFWTEVREADELVGRRAGGSHIRMWVVPSDKPTPRRAWSNRR